MGVLIGIHAAALTDRRQQRLSRDAGCVPSGIPRQPSAIASDVGYANAGAGGEFGRDLITWAVEREAEHIEAACDIGDGRGSKGGSCSHDE